MVKAEGRKDRPETVRSRSERAKETPEDGRKWVLTARSKILKDPPSVFCRQRKSTSPAMTAGGSNTSTVHGSGASVRECMAGSLTRRECGAK